MFRKWIGADPSCTQRPDMFLSFLTQTSMLLMILVPDLCISEHQKAHVACPIISTIHPYFVFQVSRADSIFQPPFLTLRVLVEYKHHIFRLISSPNLPISTKYRILPMLSPFLVYKLSIRIMVTRECIEQMHNVLCSIVACM